MFYPWRFRFLLYVILLSCLTVNIHAQTSSQTGAIDGTVYESGSQKTLMAVEVTITELKQSVLTNSFGNFAFNNILPGEYNIIALAKGYKKSEVYRVVVEAGKISEVEIYLNKTKFVLSEVVSRTRRLTKDINRQAMSNEEIKRIPGTGGDALRALSSLPGVGVINDFSGQLYIRGGGPEDNLFYFDRSHLLYPYHFGAVAATINSEIINRIDVYAGGFGAQFGSDAQAVIDIYTRDGKKENVGVTTNISMLMSEVLIESPIGKSGSWYLAGRRSYIDLLPIEVEGITALPRFWDYQMKLSYDLTEKNHLSFNAYGADDFMEMHVKDEDVKGYSEFAGKFHYKSNFHAQGLHLESLFSSKLISSLSFSHTPYLMDLGFGEGFFIRVKPDLYGLRHDLLYTPNPSYELETGVDLATGLVNISSFFTHPPEEGRWSGPDFDFLADVFKTDSKEQFTFIEGYIQGRYTPIAPLSLTLGARADYFNLTGGISLQPRGSLSFRAPRSAELRFAWGKYFQSPQPYQIMDDWGNPDVKDSIATHYIIEAERQLSSDTILKVAGYYKKLSKLITRDKEHIYLNQGSGSVQGIEVFLKKHDASGRFFGWLSYAYSLSRRKDKPDEPERLYSYDQTHVVTLTGSYELTPTWEIGAKWHYSTGTPYTPVIDAGGSYDHKTGRILYYPIYGDINSKRILPFHRLDISISKLFLFKRWQMSAYFEILNLYNRKNVLTIDYTNDYSEQETVYQLPIIPYFGIKMQF